MIFTSLTYYEQLIMAFVIYIALSVIFLIITYIITKDLDNAIGVFVFSLLLVFFSYVIYFNFFDRGQFWILIFVPFLAIITIFIAIIAIVICGGILLLTFFFFKNTYNSFIDFIATRKIRKKEKENKAKLDLERSKWDEFSSMITLKCTDVDNLVLDNKLDEAFTKLTNIKKEIERDNDHPRYWKKKNRIVRNLNPFIEKFKTQKEILEKYSKMISEYESINEDPEFAKDFFNYCLKITNLHNSKKIPDGFFNYMKNLNQQMVKKLKETLIKNKIEKDLSANIECDFLYRDRVDYFNILEKWRILNRLEIDLKNITLKEFQDYIEKISVKEIEDIIKLVDGTNLEKKTLQNISFLVKGKHEIKKLLKTSK